MRQFRALPALVAVVVVAALLVVALVSMRQAGPGPVTISASPTPSLPPPGPSVAPTTVRPSITPSPTPSPSPSPSPSPAPTASAVFLQPLTVSGFAGQATLTTVLVAPAPGTTRFTIVLAYASPLPARAVPAFTVTPAVDGSLTILVPGGSDTTSRDATIQGPIGSVRRTTGGYVLGTAGFPLWRALVLFDPLRIAIDVGSPPGAVSDDGNTAVYAPVRGSDIGRTFRILGAVRAFEATYLWRVKDSDGKVLAGAPATASIGTSALWGDASTDVTLPAGVAGNVTLDVYQVSPKDGSEMSRVSVPLAVGP